MITDSKYLYEELSYKVIGCVYEVHKELGGVHKEIVYHKALAIELNDKNIPYEEEKEVAVYYKKQKIGAYRPDFIIDNKIIVEIKVVPKMTKAMLDQAYYYVKGTDYKLVLLVNFGAEKVGIKRLIYDRISDENVQRSSVQNQRSSAYTAEKRR